MANNQSGIKISPDEYFERQKNAEETCRKGIKRLIIQAICFVGFALLTLLFFEMLPNFFIVWHLIIVLSLAMALGSLLMIRKQIKTYKYSLERIVEYMLSGGIIIEIPQEDYEKFDIIKSGKERYKSKSLEKLQKEQMEFKTEKQKREEYERKVEEDFQKQYYSDENDE